MQLCLRECADRQRSDWSERNFPNSLTMETWCSSKNGTGNMEETAILILQDLGVELGRVSRVRFCTPITWCVRVRSGARFTPTQHLCHKSCSSIIGHSDQSPQLIGMHYSQSIVRVYIPQNTRHFVERHCYQTSTSISVSCKILFEKNDETTNSQVCWHKNHIFPLPLPDAYVQLIHHIFPIFIFFSKFFPAWPVPLIHNLEFPLSKPKRLDHLPVVLW